MASKGEVRWRFRPDREPDETRDEIIAEGLFEGSDIAAGWLPGTRLGIYEHLSKIPTVLDPHDYGPAAESHVFARRIDGRWVCKSRYSTARNDDPMVGHIHEGDLISPTLIHKLLAKLRVKMLVDGKLPLLDQHYFVIDPDPKPEGWLPALAMTPVLIYVPASAVTRRRLPDGNVVTDGHPGLYFVSEQTIPGASASSIVRVITDGVREVFSRTLDFRKVHGAVAIDKGGCHDDRLGSLRMIEYREPTGVRSPFGDERLPGRM